MNEFYPDPASNPSDNVTNQPEEQVHTDAQQAAPTNFVPPTEAEPDAAQTAQGYTFTPDGEYHGKPASNVGTFERKSAPASYTPPRCTYGTGVNQNQYQPYSGRTAQPTHAHAPKPPKKKKSVGVAAVIAIALVAAIIGGTGGVLGYMAADKWFAKDEAVIRNNENQTITIDTQVSSVVEAVAQKCSPSVVGIRTTTTVSSFFGNQESSGEGSGIIYTADGYIITNYHVIESAAENSRLSSTKVEVFLASDTDTAIPAEIVGYNISNDLAVIKIDKTGLPAIEVGDSDAVNVGQYAIAIGNPGGLSFMGSVSYGIVSGVSRTLETTESGTEAAQYIQTDAAINPGNSGGALVNAKGQLIGVNSVKLVASGYEGMGFAIPSNKVVEICQDIISNENEPEPYLGVQISTTYDAATLQMYGYPTGAVISRVSTGSPAEEAGLQRGDIITSFNGVEITDYTVFMTQMTQCKVGQTVELSVYRSGRTYSRTVTLGSNN